MEEGKQDWVDFQKAKQVSFSVALGAAGLLEKMEKVGDEWRGLCPLHKAKQGKLTFYVNERKRLFNCFACKKRGNVLDFAAAFLEKGLKDAARWLLECQGEDGQEKLESAIAHITEGDKTAALRVHVGAVVDAFVSALEKRLEKRDEFVRSVTDWVLGILGRV